jgi:hypothetical protein
MSKLWHEGTNGFENYLEFAYHLLHKNFIILIEHLHLK